MKRVLVTGLSGFIGHHTLVHLRDRDFEIHGLSRSEREPAPGLHWHRGDLMDADALAPLLTRIQPTHLLHCAWYVEPGAFWSSPENLRHLEVGSALIRGFEAAGGERVVVAGSCAEYDWRFGRLSEANTPTDPASLYGTAKDSLRRVLQAYARETNLSWAWARIFFPFGPGEPSGRLIPSVIDSLLRGEPTRCSPGDQARDFLYVDDVAAALVALLDSELGGPVNVCSGHATTVRAIVETLGALAGRSELVRLGDLPALDQAPLLLGSTERLTELGFSPARDLTEGLAQTLDWWRIHREA